MSSRPAAALDRVLQAIAALVLVSTLATALHDASQAWDSWYYHLPFAARLAGVVPGDVFVFHAANAARFAGYPLLAERLQGLLWRLTGRPECANLVAFASVPLFAWFLRRRFGVPLHLSVLALLAVPLVQTHATSAYVNLPANTAVSVALLLAIASFAARDRPTDGTLALAAFAGAVAANMKAQLHPLVALALVAIVARALPSLTRDLRASGSRGRAFRTIALLAVAFPFVLATPLANLVAHGNPYFPLRLTVLGHALPGPEIPYSASPPWLAHAPGPVRFACSLLEVGIRPMSEERRWTVDQWMPDDSMGNRMGGFFGAYVVWNVGLLAWRVARDRDRRTRAAALGFGALTLAVSLMPQSHELRYYMCWMIVLVGVNLWLACAKRVRAPGPVALGFVAAVALGAVALVTRGAYVLPIGSSFEALLATRVDAAKLATIRDGERVCVRREPWNVLWAATFHPPKRYVVVEAEEPSQCGDARPLD